MTPEDIKILKSEPIVKNTLPLIFDKKLNDAVFKYDFGKPMTMSFPEMNLGLEYISYKRNGDKDDDRIGSLLVTTSFTITSVHHLYNYFQIFQAFTEREIIDFKGRFNSLGLINYPLERITIPSFDDMFPILKELYQPYFDQQ